MSLQEPAGLAKIEKIPTYDLTQEYRFKHWNSIFGEFIAKPLGLCHGQHAYDFCKTCENYDEVIYHTRAVFSPEDVPAYDKETLVISTEPFGRIVFNKTAFRLENDHWHVELLPVDGDRIAELVHEFNALSETEGLA